MAVLVALSLIVLWWHSPNGSQGEAARPRDQLEFEVSPAELEPAKSIEVEPQPQARVVLGTQPESLGAAPSNSQPAPSDAVEELRIVQVQTPDGTPLPNFPIKSHGPWWAQKLLTDESGRIYLVPHPKSLRVELPPEPGTAYLIDDLPITDGIRYLTLEGVGAVRFRLLDLDGVELGAQAEAHLRPQQDPGNVETVRFEPGQTVYLSPNVGPLELRLAALWDTSVEPQLVAIDPSLRANPTWEAIGIPGAFDHPADISLACRVRRFSFAGRLLNGPLGRGPFTRKKLQSNAKNKPNLVDVTLAADTGSVTAKFAVPSDGQFDVSFFVQASEVQDLGFAFDLGKGEDAVGFTYHTAPGGGLGAGRHKLGELAPHLEPHSSSLKKTKNN